jgi:integrase
MAQSPRARPKRRKPGTGTIRCKAGRDQPYEAAFPLDHGRYRYEYFSTRPEAEAHLDRLTAERDHTEQPRNIAGGSRRVDQFLPAWLESKQGHVRHKTYRGYKYYCELASGQIGTLRLDQVTREKADALIGYFHRRGFQNVSQLRACLLQAFEYAFEEDYIKKNPFSKAKAPSVTRRPGIALSEAERTLLLMLAATEDKLLRDVEITPLYPLWHIYSRLGLRKGEGMALLWGKSGIDLDAGMLTVSRQITAAGKLQYISDPKTKRSKRTLPIPPDLIEILRQHQKDQIKRAANDPHWQNHGLVFPGLHGAPVSYWYITSRWRKLCKRAGIIGMTIHDLRHTALTLFELGGTPRNVVQAIAGHSSQAITGLYTEHVDMASMRRAMGA